MKPKEIVLIYTDLKGKVKGEEMLRQDFVGALGEPTLEAPSVRFSHPSGSSLGYLKEALET